MYQYKRLNSREGVIRGMPCARQMHSNIPVLGNHPTNITNFHIILCNVINHSNFNTEITRLFEMPLQGNIKFYWTIFQ